ncbi:MAG: hypothetical protein OQK04_14920, partial [Kangiellaceae bacterium]|nr:hypothetical protein [Kangiellaceae bacterium]
MRREIITFVVVVLICIVGFHKINQFYVNHALERDGEEFIIQLQKTIVDSIKLLDELPSLADAQCGEQS